MDLTYVAYFLDDWIFTIYFKVLKGHRYNLYYRYDYNKNQIRKEQKSF